MKNKPSIDLGIELKNEGNAEEATKVFRYLINEGKDVDKAYYHLALMAVDEGENEQAIECYEAALEVNPRYFKAANNLGTIYLKREQYQEAYFTFKTAHELMLGELLPLYNMGMAVYGLRDFKTALGHLLQAKDMEAFSLLPLGHQKELTISIADCYLNLKDVDNAEMYYEKASALPTGVQLRAFNQLAFIALEIRKDHPAALRWIDQALAIDPVFKPSVQNKGLILKGIGKHEEALPYLEKVIELDPNGFEGYYNLACLQCARGREQDARKAVEKAMQLAPFIKDHLREDPDFTPYAKTGWFQQLVR